MIGKKKKEIFEVHCLLDYPHILSNVCVLINHGCVFMVLNAEKNTWKLYKVSQSVVFVKIKFPSFIHSTLSTRVGLQLAILHQASTVTSF